MKKLILASNSPRRKEILNMANIDFAVMTSNCIENNSHKFDEKNIINNSKNKALAVGQIVDEDCLILAADTMVILNNVCLVKPQNLFEAIFMLKKLSDKTHLVITSHTLFDTKTKRDETRLSKSEVTFRKLPYYEIIKYLLAKKPFDKAGSYGIQDFLTTENYTHPPEKSFISNIKGSYFNVMGLDIDLVKEMLSNF